MQYTRLTQIALLMLFTTAVAVEPFNGKDLTGWKLKRGKNKSHWTPGSASINEKDPRALNVQPDGTELINAEGHGVDLYTAQTFGDVVVELDVMVPKGSNSGVYLMGEYEIQVLDSFGNKTPGVGDMGAVYGVAAPNNPVFKAPGQWNTLRIEFHAPRFDGPRKTAHAKFVKVELNGRMIHQNVEVPTPTRSSLTGKEKPTGPLLLQGDHGPVAYRNIRITPIQ